MLRLEPNVSACGFFLFRVRACVRGKKKEENMSWGYVPRCMYSEYTIIHIAESRS